MISHAASKTKSIRFYHIASAKEEEGVILYTFIVFALSALLLLLVQLAFKNEKRNFLLFFKCLTVVFCTVGLFRFFLSDSFVFVRYAYYSYESPYNDRDILMSILRWGYYLNYVVLPMGVFFNSKLFKNIAVWFCLPFSLLSAVFFNRYMYYFLSPDGYNIHGAVWFRYGFFAFELILAILIPLLMVTKQKHKFHIKDKEERNNFFLALPLILLQMLPVYLPQSLIGFVRFRITELSLVQITWIICLIVVTFGVFWYFTFTDYRTRYMFCMFLTLVLFFHYNSLYLVGLTVPRLPFQLCNIGAYFYMVCVPFKKKKMFDFCLLANVVGAVIAIMAPDESSSATGFWGVHYIWEHSLVLLVPLFCMLLRVFPRVKTKSLKYMTVGFTIYFVFCLLSGTILNGFEDITGYRVNYFFLFETDKAIDVFPFMSFCQNYVWHIGRFTFYPVMQITMYLGFQFFCLLLYLLFKVLYNKIDDDIKMRASRIALMEKLTGKKRNRKIDLID